MASERPVKVVAAWLDVASGLVQVRLANGAGLALGVELLEALVVLPLAEWPGAEAVRERRRAILAEEAQRRWMEEFNL